MGHGKHHDHHHGEDHHHGNHHHHHGEDHHHGDDCAVCNRQEDTASQRFGISSFVYTRRRPFDPLKLSKNVLKKMAAAQSSDSVALHETDDGEAATATNENPFLSVVR